MIGYGAFLIAVLVVVSGVIAYVGDVLGRWLGRRRVTVFGLRPRHTAMAISVFAGMLIAAWTLGVSMVVSKDVRDGLTRVVALRQQIAGLRGNAGSLARQNRALKEQQSVLREEAESSRRAAQQASAEKAKADKAAAEARKALARSERALAAADKELARRKARLAEISLQLRQTRTELARGEQAAIKMAAEVLHASRQVRQLAQERARLEAEIQELTGWRTRAMRTFAQIYTAPLITQAGEPLLDAIVEAGAGKAEVRRALDAFVDRLEDLARSRGAEGGDGHGPVIVQLAVADQESKKLTLYDEDAVLNLLDEAILEMGGSVIVRAVSLGNTVRGEPILVDFHLFKNRQVFRRGEVIAETTVDGSLSEAKVLAALVDLLRNEVGRRARQQGVLPAVQETPGTQPLFPSPSMPVGEVSMETLLSLTEQIRSRGGPVRVVARAAADTWAAGPLGVELSVAAS